MDDWLQPTQNNGTIIHSCSDLRWTRSKCSRVPLINGAMRHRTGERIRADQIHTYDCTHYCIIECLKILMIYDDAPLKVWCETKYTYTTNSDKINRNKVVPKATYLTYTALFVCLPEQMLSAPEQFVSLPEQLVCATEQLQNCSGIVRMSSGAVNKCSGTVCKSSGAFSKCSGAVTKVFRSS